VELVSSPEKESTMKREDVHRPAVINPADYEFVAQEEIVSTTVEEVVAN
jgi:hypothetical protein